MNSKKSFPTPPQGRIVTDGAPYLFGINLMLWAIVWVAFVIALFSPVLF